MVAPIETYNIAVVNIYDTPNDRVAAIGLGAAEAPERGS